jgi:hypothetical protein
MMLFSKRPALVACQPEEAGWVVHEDDYQSLSPRQLGWNIVSEHTCSMSYKDAILLSRGSGNNIELPGPVVVTASIKACDTVICAPRVNEAAVETCIKTFSEDSIAVEDALFKEHSGGWKKPNPASKGKKNKSRR